ncbi:hypothetical protein J5U22_01783 [Saccharolobus shibatae]|uniref:Uncharacterized protein n=1 Tax=Saccharolobus shibatae TaxID=2286 RepID=A0A8F5BVG6_9CREN|nr:hypothetical protein J5U21_01863 [Saccharolobus shibatae]QXJ35236.1 hypothetical protein J5U22_01783 [Saccharolobus shibatae]
MYGEYINEPTNGLPINTSPVSFGLEELKSELSGWVYDIVK